MAIDTRIKDLYSSAKQNLFGEENTTPEPSYSLNKTRKGQKGFTLTELLIGGAIVGLLAAISIPTVRNWLEPAEVAQCTGNMQKAATDIAFYTDGGHDGLMSQADYEHLVWKDQGNKGIWYVPNNKDKDKGHGNELDGCDEENPGKSLPGRECVPMQFVLVCDHDHRDAKYFFSTEDGRPTGVAYEGAEKIFTKDFAWYQGKKDPGFDRWYGREVTVAD